VSQPILNVRVRPARVTLLIARTASQDDLLLGLKFLSRLWGGRYCQLQAVEPNGNDPVALFRLSQSRPDFVYGIGIDNDVWNNHVHQACQPRGYGPLEQKYVDNLHDSTEQHSTAAHVIHHLRRTPVGPGRRERTLRLIGCDPKSPLLPFIAALFGIHYENLGTALPNEGGWFPETGSVSAFIATHTDIVSRYARCWLDLASYGLTPRLFGSAEIPPTIVLVDSLVSDLSLFWNLRAAADSDIPEWAIPIPASAAGDPAVLGKLKEWLMAFEQYQRRPSFCRVTSASVPSTTLDNFARRFQEAMTGTHIQHVDPWEPLNRLPVVIACESEQQMAVNLSGQTLTFRVPRPNILEGVSRGSWMVDIGEDVRRKRAIQELCLPSRFSTMAVLNTSGPMTLSMHRIVQLGNGPEGINLYCTERQEIVNIHLPTGQEILEEILRDANITPEPDEKRACYLPVMKMFGGLSKAAQAFIGQRGDVLRALLNGPLSLGDLQGKAKLGKGKLAELTQPELPATFLSRLHPISRRVFRRRCKERWIKMAPSRTDVEFLLEFWADQQVLSRQWRLGPCVVCMGSFWEPHLRISKPVSCPGCGSRLRLPPQVPIGYTLHRLVAHAIREGLIPVVLTGRFLKNLTGDGFFWMPGVKYRWNDKQGDLDIVACCDGHLVIGECKTLGDTPPDTGFWEEIFKQLCATIEVGKACKASFVVLAVLADGFPPDFQEKVDKVAGPSMRCLLLNKQDLAEGYRKQKGPEDTLEMFLRVDDLVIDPMPDTPRPRPTGARQIQTPAFSVNF
jgi:hypothetical protein